MKRQRFEVRTHLDPFTGLLRKDVFVDEKLFEWEVDEKTWKNMKELGPDFANIAKGEILAHFCDSLSDFLGRKIGPGNVIKAIQTGWI